MGMELQETTQAGDFSIYRVGFADQSFSFELVPLDLMKDNPHGLSLGTPSICFYTKDIPGEHQRLNAADVKTTEITQRGDKSNFAFSDNEDRWFAALEDK
jgi:hypothetical protein